MGWQISFWILAAILVLPLPFKLLGYFSGKDDSPVWVKLEELANAGFMALGLLAFHGFIEQTPYLTPGIWAGWLVLALLWSLASLFWSPKLRYAADLLGVKHMRVLAAFSTLLFAPLFVAVWLYISHWPGTA
ncbi:hypothetical protein [Shewanella sedimentimangrovi]|uniref:MFS transporter n=1 Tax=Shewanella sedimentimangrovi TaxID=2814293 RepID=A0ABX7R0D2_9GAMM|nr:hypothetical protein [Shewanella sedimentimangrovi]QSX37231.1 hypothetical protein JYB85_18645 [Shewanella sedimentimangrovi]